MPLSIILQQSPSVENARNTVVQYIQKIAKELSCDIEELRSSEGLSSRVGTLVEQLNDLKAREFLPAAQRDFVEVRRRLRCWATLDDLEWEMLVAQSASPVWVSKQRYQYQLTPMRGLNVSLESILPKVELMKDLGNFIKGDHSTGARHAAKNAVHLCNQINTLLDSYLGDDTLHKRREFTFIKDGYLRRIAERDFHELDQKAFPSGSDKSVVILAGGILEAVLYDLLTRDPARGAQAVAATKAAKKKGGVKDIMSSDLEEEWPVGAVD